MLNDSEAFSAYDWNKMVFTNAPVAHCIVNIVPNAFIILY